MPHVIVKLWPVQSKELKQTLTDKIVQAVTTTLGYGDESVSVALEEIPAEDWKAEVYEPDILGKAGLLTKRPGYKM